MIRTTYPNRICYRPGCDDHECCVLLSKGVRIGECATYPLRESGWSCSVDIPPGCLTSGILLRRHSIRIFRIRRLTPDGRGGRFNFPSQTYSDPLIALTRRVFLSVYSAAVFSWSFLIFPTDFLRYFVLDICCLNPQSLLVTHLS